ncbi:zinc finger MYND domain-containing protein 15 [Iris pallida]|uniref:Zinc finger MYND domain-containing protein 15 n=1 Tax=Iris pallida TaxID=29817 RepID=A0AAX6I9B8_IRIPA|nr:zinc finger MYND domain-containing protein 15 [Iris pallida]
MECAAKGRGSPCSPGPPIRRCGSCGAIAYCSQTHQMLHWNDHKEECSRLQQQMSRADALNDFPFTFPTQLPRSAALGSCEQETRCCLLTSIGLHKVGLWKSECSCGPPVASSANSWITASWDLPSMLCPCTEPRKALSSCLVDWKDYYQWRCLPFHSPVALLLHWPLTVYHCFQVSGVQSLNPEVSNKLHIHYLGPDKELSQLAVFRELQALIPRVQLHIELIGPAVPQFRDGETVRLCNYVCCSDTSCSCRASCTDSDAVTPNSRSSTVLLKLHKGFYHDRYREIIKDSRPHLIVAPNAGIAAYSSWLPTIEVIKEMGIPAIFTDFCEEAALLAERCIGTVTGRPLRFPVQVNPFRQPMMVDDSPLCVPCYSNCFLFGM